MDVEGEKSIGGYIAVWAGLLGLTAMTIGGSRLDLGYLNVVVALLIATLKATLVCLFFMHLKDEGRGLQLMVLSTLTILAMIVGFCFFDVAVRYQ